MAQQPPSATGGPRYWIGVASRDHVARGVAGGFCQLCHGKSAPLKRMAPGDWIVYYSPKERREGDAPCQQFTAIGEVTGRGVYVFEMAPRFAPFRRDVRFVAADAAPIRPLVEQLSFIRDPKRWGYAFRFGHFEMTGADFELIATAMRADRSIRTTAAPPAASLLPLPLAA